jgi:hypothetical protein
MNDDALKAHLNALLDELKWFHSQNIGLRISPKKAGWNISIMPPGTLTTAFVDPPSEHDLTLQELSVAEHRSQIGDPRL